MGETSPLERKVSEAAAYLIWLNGGRMYPYALLWPICEAEKIHYENFGQSLLSPGNSTSFGLKEEEADKLVEAIRSLGAMSLTGKEHSVVLASLDSQNFRKAYIFASKKCPDDLLTAQERHSLSLAYGEEMARRLSEVPANATSTQFESGTGLDRLLLRLTQLPGPLKSKTATKGTVDVLSEFVSACEATQGEPPYRKVGLCLAYLAISQGGSIVDLEGCNLCIRAEEAMASQTGRSIFADFIAGDGVLFSQVKQAVRNFILWSILMQTRDFKRFGREKSDIANCPVFRDLASDTFNEPSGCLELKWGVGDSGSEGLAEKERDMLDLAINMRQRLDPAGLLSYGFLMELKDRMSAIVDGNESRFQKVEHRRSISEDLARQRK